MFCLKPDDAFTFFKNDVVPLTNTTVSLDLPNRIIILVTEADFIYPILTGFHTYLANGAILRQITNLIALVDA
jgi:hypothetical protein